MADYTKSNIDTDSHEKLLKNWGARQLIHKGQLLSDSESSYRLKRANILYILSIASCVLESFHSWSRLMTYVLNVLMEEALRNITREI